MKRNWYFTTVQAGVAACGLLAPALFALTVQAELAPRSASEIITMARPAVGHGYHWGFGNWTEDGTNIGTCTSSGYTGSFGADCSGFVAKVWQVPTPSPVEINSHPYSTDAFFNSEIDWVKLPKDFSDVQRGDAVVYREGSGDDAHGHIMIIDQHVDGKTFWVYHASACKRGIRHETSKLDAKYIPIRRKALVSEPCDPAFCNNHGECGSDNTCSCVAGFEGDFCEQCSPGYTGYPACAISGACPAIHGELKCGSTVDLPLPASGSISDYSCGVSGRNGGELVFSFAANSVGKGSLQVESSEDVSLQLLRDECDPQACIDKGGKELEFEYGAGDRYFVVLDSASGAASAKLTLTCATDPKPFIGSPCTVDSDCAFSRRRANGTDDIGYCYKDGSASFCSFPCAQNVSCPDMPNHATTTCVANPDNANKGMCASTSHSLNNSCASIPGTSGQSLKRFKQSSSATVCMPADEACTGSIDGQVVDSKSQAPIEGVSLTFEGTTAAPVMTGADGSFTSPPLSCADYTIRVTADGYLPANVGAQVIANKSNLPQILLEPETDGCTGASAVTGRVLNGIDNTPIADATIEVHSGANSPTAPVVATVMSDADGNFQLDGVDSGYYTLTAKADGYPEGVQQTVNLCGNSSQALDLFLAPSNTGSLRFVLSWKQPDDLDLHLLTPQGQEVFFDAACRGSATEPPFAVLDADHQLADGPESITISRFLPGRYELFVHNYSTQNDEVNVDLRDSHAEVVAYDGSNHVVGRFAVPAAGNGVFWDVLSFDGSSSPPTLTAVRSIHSNRLNPYDSYAGLCNPQ
jgi:Carboxypeptidase regulatory-like domain